jgi:hypothetical protein
MSMQQRGKRHVERMAGVSECAVDHIEKLDKVARRTYGLDDIQPGVKISLNVLSLGILDEHGNVREGN